VTICLLAVGARSGSGQCELEKLRPADGQASDFFGASIAVGGPFAIIGTPQDDDRGANSGSAHVYLHEGASWHEEGKLLASDGTAGDFFGFAVATCGGTVIVGAWGRDEGGTSAGAAYVYRWDGATWIEEGKLLAVDGLTGDQFGRSVGICGDLAVVGAPGNDERGADAGAVYVFRFEGSEWAQEAKLLGEGTATGDALGSAVATREDVIAAGACQDDDAAVDGGSVLIFRRDGFEWLEESVLVAPDAAAGAQLGWSVALGGGRLLAGANRDPENGSRSGAAYVYRDDAAQWIEEGKLTAADGAAEDHLGHSVATDGVTALVGARWDDENGYHSGSAYVFVWNGSAWEQRAKLLASDGDAGDKFGFALGFDDGAAVIGAFGDDDHGSDSGSAYAFDLAGADCNDNGICDEQDIAGGTSTDCNSNEVPDECDIADGTSRDVNNDGVPDECQPCVIADLTGDGAVGILDLLVLLALWGSAGPLGDINADGVVGISDLLILLANWGPCP
jgi:hypothetical protein